MGTSIHLEPAHHRAKLLCRTVNSVIDDTHIVLVRELHLVAGILEPELDRCLILGTTSTQALPST